MDFFKICKFCKKRSIIIKKRTVILPNGLEVESEDKMCGRCYKKINKLYEGTKKEDGGITTLKSD